MKKSFIIVWLVLIAVLVLVGWNYWKNGSIKTFADCQKAGYKTRESYPAVCTAPDGRTFTQLIGDKEITVSGSFSCLPHKKTDGPQTLECAFGIKDNKGNYYALLDPNFKYTSQLVSSQKVKVTGTFSALKDDKYDAIGTIQIKSLVKEE